MKKNRKSAINAIVFGVVQGVGFRPFIYRLAIMFKYKGWVKNMGYGVKIHLESEDPTDFADFFQALKDKNPPLSQIEEINIKSASFLNLKGFEIKKTKSGESFVFISPDISLCSECHKEMTAHHDRRFHYPFINCTDCGPRYTIVNALPYDRKQTTMAHFKMCGDCRTEYINPLDRRYHAQPIACPQCGPHIELRKSRSKRALKGGIKKAQSLIREGKIIAVKGLGGFHLVCDALNYEAVRHLRQIKTRKTKPLALMARNLTTVKKYCSVSPSEEKMLLSARRPIVLLQKQRDIKGISPHLNEIGFMLPYTPLHYLLLDNIELIVATSSNKKDSPIIKDEEEGIDELCDYILTHNRPIHMRADDSVMKVIDEKPLFLRRARGFVPYPQKISKELVSSHQVLALGAELKDTISIYKKGYAVTSQFLGDLDDYQNYQYFIETITHLTRLFKLNPHVVVSDLHPDFHSTKYCQKLNLPHFQVQHHFAHVLATLLEHKIPPQKKVIGVAFDGYGYGDDGNAWGGEFLIANYKTYHRFAHFKYVPLPGGDLASKQPWRMAISYLVDAFGLDFPRVQSFKKIKESKIQGIREMINQSINSPLSSSCGRLFDAVAFLSGLAPLEVEFEAEAPMRLESAADMRVNESYGFSIRSCRTKKEADRSKKKRLSLPSYEISFLQTIRSITEEIELKNSASYISAKFHNTLAKVIVSVAEKARTEHHIDTAVLAGGVFSNKTLLQKTQHLLETKGFNVLRPMNYSPNDESISLGQIAYALYKLKTSKRQ